MQLPADLKEAIEKLLQQSQIATLEKASSRLTKRYRAELQDGTMHLNSENAALAYIAARLPATYAAISSALNYVIEIIPDFAPKNQLDIGAGPGTAVLASCEVLPSLEAAILCEQSPFIAEIGQYLTKYSTNITIHWQELYVQNGVLQHCKPADLITLAYVLDELQPNQQDDIIDELWQLTNEVLLIVEPGTPLGFQRLKQQRQRLIKNGAFLIAPCPHEYNCPIIAPDWCHFAARVERSKIHRQTKAAVVPYEDEKYCYLAVSKKPVKKNYQRIVQLPKKSSGKIDLQICSENGQKQPIVVTKRQKELYCKIRKSSWGDMINFF